MVTVDCTMQINRAVTTMLYSSQIKMTQITRNNNSSFNLHFSITYENDITYKDQVQQLTDKMDTCERKVQVTCKRGCIEAIQAFTPPGEDGSQVDILDDACLCER